MILSKAKEDNITRILQSASRDQRPPLEVPIDTDALSNTQFFKFGADTSNKVSVPIADREASYLQEHDQYASVNLNAQKPVLDKRDEMTQ